jgi:rRNA maturation protein Nop10
MILKKCHKCNTYNLTDKCRKCGEETKEAHQKFIKIRDEPQRNFKRKS